MLKSLRKVFSPTGKPPQENTAPEPRSGLAGQPEQPDESELHKIAGDTHLNKGEWVDAARCYLQAISIKPNYAAAYCNFGYAQIEQGLYEDAERSLKQSLSINPELAHAYCFLGMLSQRQGDFDTAINHFQSALELKPDFEIVSRDLCFLLFQQGQIEPARQVILKGIALNPNYADFHYFLGNLYGSEGAFDKAVDCYQRALSIQPEYVQVHFNLGNMYREQGNLAKALDCYQKALSLKPDYAEAYFKSGDILNNLGQLDAAVESYRRGLALQPDLASAHFSLGNCLKGLDQPDEAVASYRRAIEIKPDFAEAQRHLGKALIDLGQLDNAVASIRNLLKLHPENAEAHNNLGVILRELGQFNDAEASCRRALELKPDLAAAHYNLGLILLDAGKLEGAVTCYRRSLEFQPDNAEAHNSLGVTLRQLGQLNDAEVSCRRALEVNPEFAEAHNALGVTLQDLGQPDDAVACYRRALEIKPDFVEALTNFGNALKSLGQYDEAIMSYRRALETEPHYVKAHNNLGIALHTLGQLEDAMACFRRALEIKPDYVIAHSNLIFSMDLTDTFDLSELYCERKKWDQAHAAPLWRQPAHTNARDPARRLRIGYVSADFRAHSARRVFGGMLTRYDRVQYEVFAYSNYNGKSDQFTDLFKQSVTVWRNIAGLSDDAVAQLIREDRIDILVDLSGHTGGNRLLVFARKPAPIQITAWGYATGTGMRAMDVFFADPVMVPPEDKCYFSEEVRYLPSAVSSFFNEPFPDVNELPALTSGGITFGSLNRLVKISEQTYSAWAEVLLAVHRSRLLLKTPELNDASTRERVAGYFTKAGVAADRIIMQGRTSWHEHMQAFHQLDLALDPFPHGGGVTALEGLMMGVPVVTLRWPTVPGRVSASIMTTLGLTDWIAETPEQYIELAIQKAADLQPLAALRRQLRGRFSASVLGDQAAYVRAVEQEYRLLWQEWCASVH